MSVGPAGKVLLIGYGNTLRGDDGAGPAVVREAMRLHPDCVTACTVHQLTPELCCLIAQHQMVVFVDASLANGDCQLAPLDERGPAPFGTHASSPETLLAMARDLFGGEPAGWRLTVPGAAFDHCEGLSVSAGASVRRAVGLVEGFLQSHQGARARRCTNSA